MTHDVTAYGADPSFSTDSTAAINAAIAAARTDGRPVLIPAGQYKVSSINATGFRQFPGGLQLRGEGEGRTQLFGVEQATAGPILDLTGSSYCRVSNLSLMGMDPGGAAPAVIPQTGLLTAESVVGGTPALDCNKNRYDSVSCLGYFGVAAIASIGQTNSLYLFCTTQQWFAGGAGLYVTGYNPYGVQSGYETVNSTPFHNNELSFVDCELHAWDRSSGVPTPGTSPTIRLEGHTYTINNLRLTRTLVDSSHDHAVFVNGNVHRLSMRDSKVYSEIGSPPAHAVLADGGNVHSLLADNCDLSTVTGSPFEVGSHGGGFPGIRHV